MSKRREYVKQKLAALKKLEQSLKYNRLRLSHNLEIMQHDNEKLVRLVSLLTTPQPGPPADCSNWILE